jgi:hypothetical protein
MKPEPPVMRMFLGEYTAPSRGSRQVASIPSLVELVGLVMDAESAQGVTCGRTVVPAT